MTENGSSSDAISQQSPLAAARAPAKDIRDWFYWLSVSEMHIPHGQSVRGGMLTDHACLRILHGARWTAHTKYGDFDYDPGEQGMALYFGPQTRHMPLTVHGSFRIVTVHLRAGSPSVVRGPEQTDVVDRILDHAAMVGHGNLAARLTPGASDKEWLLSIERELRKFVRVQEPNLPDPIITAFEKASLMTPDMSISGFAEDHGVSVRTLERLVRREYGLTPKKVLRRARALDMAAALLGVAAPDEQADLQLRYFDQSHLIKEIRTFFAMTPSELIAQNDPLLKVNLEIRQSRRLEAMGRWTADEPLPWAS